MPTPVTVREKRCPRCNKTKPASEYSQSKGYLAPRCKPCQRKFSQEHYRKNRASYLKRVKVRNKEQRLNVSKLVRGIKDKTPCFDCGERFPYWVLHFDHRDPEDKGANVSDLVAARATFARIEEEIEKCDVVCATCHANRTWFRRKKSDVIPLDQPRRIRRFRKSRGL